MRLINYLNTLQKRKIFSVEKGEFLEFEVLLDKQIEILTKLLQSKLKIPSRYKSLLSELNEILIMERSDFNYVKSMLKKTGEIDKKILLRRFNNTINKENVYLKQLLVFQKSSKWLRILKTSIILSPIIYSLFSQNITTKRLDRSAEEEIRLQQTGIEQTYSKKNHTDDTKELITITTLKKIFPRARNSDIKKYAKPLAEGLNKYGITDLVEISNFLGQIAYESGNFRYVEENLYYTTPNRINSIFRRSFKNMSEKEIAKYTRNPKKLANRVYANIIGNGDEKSGDGYRFKGRGLIQLTGRDNYEKYAKDRNPEVLKNPDLLLKPEYAVDAALWYWTKKQNLRKHAQENNISAVTKIINGGTRGLEERRKLTNRTYKVLQKLNGTKNTP